MHPEKVVLKKFIKKKKRPVATNSPMLHAQPEQIARWHFFVLHSYVASSPWPGCHSGQGSGHQVPPFLTKALQTLQQLNFAGVMHKRLLEQQQTQHVFPTNKTLQCMQCMSWNNKPKMPFRKHKNGGTCMSRLQTKEITMATYPGSKVDGSELPGYISPG